MPPIALTDAQLAAVVERARWPCVIEIRSCRRSPEAADTSRTSSSSPMSPSFHAPISRQMHGRHGISPLIELG
jgi:phage portal protein BeeE